jgi:hypothetical protein
MSIRRWAMTSRRIGESILFVSVPIVTEFSLARNFLTIAKSRPGGRPEYAQSPTRVGLCRAAGWFLVRRTLARASLEWPWHCS